MLLFEVQSAPNGYDEPLSEIYEAEHNNKVAYKAAVSLAKFYANNEMYAAVITHDKNDYKGSAFTCFYASPSQRRYASAHKDVFGFYSCNWRMGY